MSTGKKILLAVSAVVVLAVVACSSSVLTLIVSESYRARSGSGLTLSGDQYAGLQRYQRLEEILSIVKSSYIEEVDEDVLLEGAAYGMLDAVGDIYTFYYSTDAMDEMNAHVEGKYAGIGCQLTVDPQDMLITVTRTFRGSPGEEADVRPGDKIIRVAGVDYMGDQLQTAVSYMKGDPGTPVDIVFLRGGEVMEKTLVRQIVNINRIEYEMLDEDIGYLIQYEFFGDNVILFEEAMEYFKAQGAKGFVYDVRGDPGGSVYDAVGIVDMLCPEGYAVYTTDRNGNKIIQQMSDKNAIGLPFVVLVDGNSASAAEIVAGAVQDYGVGKLVGTQTYGKGIVQSVHTFPEDGDGMQLTTQYWHTPLGRNIHKVGLTPDYIVEMPDELIENPLLVSRENDVQLLKAIEVVTGMIEQGDSE